MLLFALASCTGDMHIKRVPSGTPIEIKVDKEFNSEQKEQIAKALKAWENASSGSIRFKPIWDQDKPGIFYQRREPPAKQGIFIWHLPWTDSGHLTQKLRLELMMYVGYYIPSKENDSAHILILYPDSEDFYSIILHELGHLLRLKHSFSKNAVMYRSAGSDCVTNNDAKSLCDVWECQPNPEC